MSGQRTHRQPGPRGYNSGCRCRECTEAYEAKQIEKLQAAIDKAALVRLRPVKVISARYPDCGHLIAPGREATGLHRLRVQAGHLARRTRPGLLQRSS